MKQIKEFICDNIPTDEELQKCIKAAKNENCVINLHWVGPNSYLYSIYIKENMTVEDCRDNMPTFYGL